MDLPKFPKVPDYLVSLGTSDFQIEFDLPRRTCWNCPGVQDFWPCQACIQVRARDFFHNQEETLTDPHQVNSIIAKTIWGSRKDHPTHTIDPDEAKHLAKCIVEALLDAGFQIAPLETHRG